MSWLSNILPGKSSADLSSSDADKLQAKANLEKLHMYISIDFSAVKFLGVDENQNPHKILDWKEVPTGPFEELDAGRPVKNIYDVLGKILSQERELIKRFGSFSVAISSDGVFFKTITVPKLDAADMQKNLLSEIKKTLPIDFSQVLFAQNDLGEKREATKTFFCVLIQKSTFEKFKEVFSKFSINPYFEIETFSLARIQPRDENYRLLVHQTKNTTYLIFTLGQIIHSVEVLEMGSNKINIAIEKALSIPFKEVVFLREHHLILIEEARLGGQILDEYVKDFNKTLSKAIALHILEFEKMMGVEVKSLLISGSESSSKLAKNIHDEFDAELEVEYVGEKQFEHFVADNFIEEDVRKFAVNFGLSKRVK